MRLMLEEKRMRPIALTENFIPLELMPAFRASRLDQSAEVVVAKRAEDVALHE
jgi:hypothetical protein